MGDLINLKCENCGAILNDDLTCPYCGAKYERKHNTINNEVHLVQICPAKTQTLCANAIISRESIHYMGEENASKYTISKLRESLADGLINYMKLQTHYDPSIDADIIRGEVRVVEPDFRF